MRQFHSTRAVLSRHSMPNVVKAMNSGSPLLTSLRCAWPKFLPELRNIHVHLKVEFLPCARVDRTSTDGLDADVSARLACHVISAKRVFTQRIDFTCANRTKRKCCVTSRTSGNGLFCSSECGRQSGSSLVRIAERGSVFSQTEKRAF